MEVNFVEAVSSNRIGSAICVRLLVNRYVKPLISDIDPEAVLEPVALHVAVLDEKVHESLRRRQVQFATPRRSPSGASARDSRAGRRKIRRGGRANAARQRGLRRHRFVRSTSSEIVSGRCFSSSASPSRAPGCDRCHSVHARLTRVTLSGIRARLHDTETRWASSTAKCAVVHARAETKMLRLMFGLDEGKIHREEPSARGRGPALET